MNVLVTGSSRGIGKAIALYFLQKGHKVYGIDKLDSTIKDSNYEHFVCDLRDISNLPSLKNLEILILNAGVQNTGEDIDVNLKATIAVCEKYAFHKGIRSVLFNASASARSGFEFPEYVASKAGVVGYMKNAAVRLAKLGATCNALSLGGVLTDSNAPVMEDPKAWEKIMEVTPLKKWMSLDEVAEWVYFLTVTNQSMAGQDVLVDNGELNLNCTFVWPQS